MANNNSIALGIDDIRPPLDFDTKTACAYLSVSPKVLAERRNSGRIIGYMPGSVWLYTLESLDAYLESVKSGRSE